ncbi:MAG: hypothetical protein PHV30_05315 [Candidatus Margulisbacteria bacterium]|nr:hypothetical protein [Candidatus Margulisiibacteriota bacterium]
MTSINYYNKNSVAWVNKTLGNKTPGEEINILKSKVVVEKNFMETVNSPIIMAQAGAVIKGMDALQKAAIAAQAAGAIGQANEALKKLDGLPPPTTLPDALNPEVGVGPIPRMTLEEPKKMETLILTPNPQETVIKLDGITIENNK